MQQRFDPRDGIKIPELNIRITPRTVLMGLGILGVLWLLSGIFFVGQQESGVIRRFGKFVREEGPGAHWHLPWPVETVVKPKVTELKRLEIGFRTVQQGTAASAAQYRPIPVESLMLTSDENIIDINVIVQYRISDAEKYLFNIRDQDQTIRNASEAAIRFVIGRSLIDDALTEGKTEIQDKTQQKLQEILESYGAGILVYTVQLQAVQSPEEVIDAFKDVSSAIQDKERKINEAQGYRNDIIPTARGEAEQMLRQAEAYKEEKTRMATGDAQRFLSILAEYRKAQDVTRKRLYIEAMEAILPEMEKIIIDTGGNGNILNLLQLQRGGEIR
ncbi:FtsH protease activity modulator HflK [candidate division KSB1 bacterium]